MTIADITWIDADGFHAASYEQVLDYLLDEYRTIFGADVYLEPDGQDYQWLAIMARAIHDTAMLAEQAYHNFSPGTAQGDGLSRLVRINGLVRRGASASQVVLAVTASASVSMDGAVASDSAGNRWLLDGGTVPAGVTSVTARAEQTGPVAAAAGTIRQIDTPRAGWTGVTNPTAATEGADQETDAQLRRRQAVSVAQPSETVFAGVLGGVERVPGVTRVAGYENATNATDTNGLPPHSFGVVVEGGDNREVAEAIAERKTVGTQTVGTTSVRVGDRFGVRTTIRYYRPAQVAVNVTITLDTLEGYVDSYGEAISAAVAEFLATQPIGGDVYTSRLFRPALLPDIDERRTYDIASIVTGTGTTLDADNIVVGFAAAAAPGTIQVLVNN